VDTVHCRVHYPGKGSYPEEVLFGEKGCLCCIWHTYKKEKFLGRDYQKRRGLLERGERSSGGWLSGARSPLYAYITLPFKYETDNELGNIYWRIDLRPGKTLILKKFKIFFGGGSLSFLDKILRVFQVLQMDATLPTSVAECR